MSSLRRAVLVLAVGLLSLFGCVPGLPPMGNFDRMELTSPLIKEYNIQPEELRKLQFYLGQPMAMTGLFTTRDKAITPDHRLEVSKINSEQSVEFAAGLPGMPARVWEERKFFFFGKVLKIGVCFDPRSPNNYLTFKPNAAGTYVLETSPPGKRIQYGQSIYECVGGCDDNALVLDVRKFEDFLRSREYAPGQRFSPDRK